LSGFRAGKHVIVDAKVPLDAYLKALEAPDERPARCSSTMRARVRSHITAAVAAQVLFHADSAYT
jgi:DNA anti-recombination protein RmuC